MPIRMLRTECIAVDGIHVRWYREGDIVHVPHSLAAALIRDGIATENLDKQDSKEMPLAHTPKAQMKQGKKREYRS